MIQFHRNKFTGPLDLLQKKKKRKRFSIARMSSSVLVDLYYIVTKMVYIWPLTLKDSVHKLLKTYFYRYNKQ